MNRTLFIKKLGLAAGLSTLPHTWLKTFDKFYLLQCFIAGFKFYTGPEILDKMNAGAALQLLREPENEYDDCAIALYWNCMKIGYVPARLNHVFAKLIDLKALELHAEITHINQQVQSWENVAIAIFYLKERMVGENLSIRARELATPQTPKYHSVKIADEGIGMINITDREEKIITDLTRLPRHMEHIRSKYAGSEYEFPGRKGVALIKDEDIEMLLPYVKEVRDTVNSVNGHFAELVMDFEDCLT